MIFFSKKCHRILHSGANQGQERDRYAKRNLEVLWIEALPDTYAQLTENIKEYPSQRAAQALLTDIDDQTYNFNVASNGGASSSLFEFKEHTKLWPDISFVTTVSLQSKRLSTLLQALSIPANYFDAAILDVQGAELLVLKGAGDCLSHLRYVQCEAADFESYTGSCRVNDLVEFMQTHSFRLKRKIPFASKRGVGRYYELIFQR